MRSKHSRRPISSSPKPTLYPFWRRLLAILALVPLVVGVLLILTALTGLLIWSNMREQIIVGVYYILASFTLSNALQLEWKLTIGWLLLGAAVWLGMQWTCWGARILAAALAGVGVMLLSREFLLRRRRYLEQQPG